MVERKRNKPHHKTPYSLHIEKAIDVARVGSGMLPHLIIKRDKVAALVEIARNIKPLTEHFGRLVAAGADEVRRLYWEEGLSQPQIGAKYGVGASATRNFMARSGIPVRPFSETSLGRKHTPETKAKCATAVSARWADPVARAKLQDAMRAGKARQFAKPPDA
jgi:hypothetical protein